MLRWQQVSVATKMVSTLTDDWLENNASSPSTKLNFEQLLQDIDYLSFMKKQSEAELLRPFVSERIWALYWAYYSFLSTRLIKAKLLTIPGIKHYEMLLELNERNLVEKSATTEIFASYDKNSHQDAEPYLLYLKEEMVTEFREFLSSQRASNLAAQDTAKMLHAAEDLVAKFSASSKAIKSYK